MRSSFLISVSILSALSLRAQSTDYDALTRAYQALKAGEYELAIAGFDTALRLSPDRAALHKDAAYASLKIGRNREAREHFRVAMVLDPNDLPAALEYAFLSFEAPQSPLTAKAEARRVFDRIRHQTFNLAAAATAETAFQNIDTPLRTGIARWTAALQASAPTFSVHYELAQLAEQRDEWDLAADHYLAAWHLERKRKNVLVDLGRVEKLRSHPEQATAALLAASRGGEPRSSDQARELLPERYPYVYEFRNALALDPNNTELRRELAYLLLRMELKTEAEMEFAQITESDRTDLLSAAQLGFLLLARGSRVRAMPLLERVLEGDDDALANRVRAALNLPHRLTETGPDSASPIASETGDPRVMYERSYRAGYMKDALRYLTIAHEAEPSDHALMLKLGWANNILHQDREAMDWFRKARTSADPAIAKEAGSAFNNLRPEFARVRVTAWLFPFYSTRWHDAFSYGQIKTEFRLDRLPIRPYLSVRLIGDIGRQQTGPRQEALSESSFVLAVGATYQTHGITAWAEAGRSVSYKNAQTLPDYRGGLSWSRGWGRLMGAEVPGMFWETNADEVFLSRFGNNFLTYSQTRAGWTLHGVQFLWNGNLTVDTQHQPWANFVETGPGIRLRLPGAPRGLMLSVSGLRGAYLINRDNPRRPNFFDVRAGFWYAITH